MTLEDVINYYREKQGYLKRWEINKILDKYNFDKERLFKETQDDMDGKTETFINHHINNETAQEALEKLGDMIGKAKRIMSEVSIEIIKVSFDELNDAQDAIVDFLDTFNLYDMQTSVIRSEPSENGTFTIIMDAVPGNHKEVDMGALFDAIQQYSAEFFTEAELGYDAENKTIFMEIINWREPKNDDNNE